MGLVIVYAIFFLILIFVFDESYLEFLSLTDTGGNGKLNLLTYPVSLYFICAATCIQYLRTQQGIFFDFLILMWSAVLIARIISIFLRGGVVIDIYFFFGILPEFIIAPFFVFIKSKIS
ncbi:MAG: hypothetical protein CM15mP108_3040 [Gammaproteobacteria bacterium]|nr:MAG: hypothetical protein CM15mP108_3040 [Gammaproteobacteria bacterium]